MQKQKIEPTTENKIKTYSSKNFLPEFPFMFNIFENESTEQRSISMTLVQKAKKTACFFPEEKYGNSDTLALPIPPKECVAYIIMKYKVDSRIELKWAHTAAAMNDDNLEGITSVEGKTEALDEEGEILQTYYEYSGGYGLIVANKSHEHIKLKVVLDNLSHGKQLKGDVLCELKPKSSKFFSLKNIPGAKNCSFQVDFAE